MFDVRLKRMHPRAKTPSYGTSKSACADFFPVLGDQDGEDGQPLQLIVQPGEVRMIRLGWAMQPITPGWCLMLYSRSGQGTVQVKLANSVGVIDADYVKEVCALVENNGSAPFVVSEAKAICQLKPAPAPQIRFLQVPELEIYDRDGGFGHTDSSSHIRANPLG